MQDPRWDTPFSRKPLSVLLFTITKRRHDSSAERVEILKMNGDGPGAWIRLQRLLVLAPGTTEDLHNAWTLRQYIPTRRVHTILDDLVRALRRSGDFARWSYR